MSTSGLVLSKRGVNKQVTTGFSWTNLFFGFFVPAFRGDWKWCLIQLAAMMFTCGISDLVFPFFYNKLYTKELLEAGWEPADDAATKKLIEMDLI